MAVVGSVLGVVVGAVVEEDVGSVVGAVLGTEVVLWTFALQIYIYFIYKQIFTNEGLKCLRRIVLDDTLSKWDLR